MSPFSLSSPPLSRRANYRKKSPKNCRHMYRPQYAKTAGPFSPQRLEKSQPRSSLPEIRLWLSSCRDAQAVNERDAEGCTMLMCAAYKGQLDVVKILLDDRRVDVNAKDLRSGSTALHIAAEMGWVEIVEELLICERVGVERVDNFGRTALEVARCLGRWRVRDVIEASVECREIVVGSSDVGSSDSEGFDGMNSDASTASFPQTKSFLDFQDI